MSGSVFCPWLPISALTCACIRACCRHVMKPCFCQMLSMHRLPDRTPACSNTPIRVWRGSPGAWTSTVSVGWRAQCGSGATFSRRRWISGACEVGRSGGTLLSSCKGRPVDAIEVQIARIESRDISQCLIVMQRKLLIAKRDELVVAHLHQNSIDMHG